MEQKKSFVKQVLSVILAGIIGLFLMYFLPLVIQSSVTTYVVSLATGKGTLFYSAIFYYVFIVMWFVCITFLLIKKSDRPILQVFGTKPAGNNIKLFLVGLLIGGGMNLTCACAAMLHKDIAVYFDKLDIFALLVMFVGVLIQSSAEEIVCRGFLYQKIWKITGKPILAILINPLIFALAHTLNPGVSFLALFNVFIIGVFFSLMVYYMDSLWCAFAAHTAWNFMQSCILGLPNSGSILPFSVFKLDVAAAQNSAFYDVGFGVEGTVFACVLIVLACAALHLWGRKHKKPAYYPWEA